MHADIIILLITKLIVKWYHNNIVVFSSKNRMMLASISVQHYEIVTLLMGFAHHAQGEKKHHQPSKSIYN